MYQKTLDYFTTITTIPRPSGQEQQIRAWLLQWAQDRNLVTHQDNTGNIVIQVPATHGLEKKPIITLQAHMDMVCVKAPDSTHDFQRDPLDIYEEDGWLRARGTTLGADNGMAIAMMLAVIDGPHGPLELFFTVDEERGLTGALEFDPTMIQGSYLLNLDTEDQGEICISSSGGARIDCSIPLTRKPGKFQPVRVSLQGAQGGHSGVDINKQRINAISTLLNCLHAYDKPYELYTLGGGQADNAIPADAYLIVGVEDHADLQKSLTSTLKTLLDGYDEPDAHISVTVADETEILGAIENAPSIIQTISTLPVGVFAMHPTIPNLVETSCNLGIIQTTDEHILLTLAPRSSNNEAMNDTIQTIQTHLQTVGSTTKIKSRYPGRSQNPDDEFVQAVQRIYDTVLGEPSTIVAYHAGLECGAIVSRIAHPLQAASIGPTIKDPHSINERVLLSSVEKLCHVVEMIVGWQGW